MRQSPEEKYQHSISAGEMLPDPAQAQVMRRLTDLYQRIEQADNQDKGVAAKLTGWVAGLFSNAPVRPQRGLYLWGGVGRGKTMMMDLFCTCLPEDRALRMHFHRFMRRVHDSLGRHSGTTNPLYKVADEFAAEADILCFDEFFVSDIGDAMILGELMTALFARGVSLVATSNVEPKNLYLNGLQRSRFLPAIDQIYECCDIWEIDQGQDFRLRTLQQAELYHFPLNASAQRGMAASFSALASEVESLGVALEVENRKILTQKLAGDVVWFEFSDICEGPRSQNDYIELATIFSTVFVSSIPALTTSKEDAARRFISLVDEFYDRGVKLIVSAEESITTLYQGQRLSFEFERTQSRLLEMQSKEYLAGAHHAVNLEFERVEF
ncbi:MAG: cell division protein ZapE [Candidatus Azotimanducaceae bacterium]|jgi:cell division protein ZapE|tara:strand:+ start:14158 stop:15303 length:1146 start_codon:yes stop_codon:yes gene_type:complete